MIRNSAATYNQHQSHQQQTVESEADHHRRRPNIQIPPRGIGPVPVTDFNQNDVLCGRGGRINGHAGNIQFRRICAAKRDQYLAVGVKKIEKAYIASSVVQQIRSMGGRFLKQDGTGEWYDIGCARATTKAGQVMREHNPTTKKNMVTLSQQLDRHLNDQQLPLLRNLYPKYPVLGKQQQQQQLEKEYSGVEDSGPLAFTSTPVTRLSLLILHRERVRSDQQISNDTIMTPDYYEVQKDLMRQSILSDISECSVLGTSLMEQEEEEAGLNSIISNNSPLLLDTHQEEMDGRLAIPSLYSPEVSTNHLELLPSNRKQKLSNENKKIPANSKPIIMESNWKQGRTSWRRRASKRKNSLWSMSSIASTNSMLSINSAFSALSNK